MEFAPGVAENLGYYVYQLMNPTTGDVFYVGKGIGGRMLAHVAWANRAEDEKSEMIRKIKEDLGRDPTYRIVAHGLTEETAFLVEAVLIEQIGLGKLMNRVRGHNHDSLMLTVADIAARYSAGSVHVRDIKEPTIFVSLNGGRGKSLVGRDPVKGTRRGSSYWDIRDDKDQIQERTLGIWKVADCRADKIERVAGVFAGIVRTCYTVSGWEAAAHPTGTRKRFKLVREETESPLLGSQVIDEDGSVLTAFLYGREKAYAGF
jgi:hypothetical protein